MNRDKSDNITPSLQALSVFRGIYKRVAVQLDIDPSYVSRVARGERNAPFVSDAIHKEIQRALGKAGLHNGDGNTPLHNGNGRNHDHPNGTMAAMLDGHQTNGHRRDAHSGDGHLASPDGHHPSAVGKQPGRKARKTQTQKSTSAARRRKP
jgi:prepilin-type processing-associated H-X9-DG protein